MGLVGPFIVHLRSAPTSPGNPHKHWVLADGVLMGLEYGNLSC